MRTKLDIKWLLIPCLCFPLVMGGQSTQTRNVISARELSIPPKAVYAFEQGVELLEKQDAAGSMPHFQRAIREFPNYYEAYYTMGDADLRLDRIADAEQAFRKSQELSGGQYAPAQFALGAVFNYQKRFTEAETVIRRGLDLEPNSWIGHYFLGWALAGLNRLEDAEKNVRESLRRKSDSLEALRLLADIHNREKNYTALVNDLDEYLKLDPDSPTGVKARAIRDIAQRLLVEPQRVTAIAEPQS